MSTRHRNGVIGGAVALLAAGSLVLAAAAGCGSTQAEDPAVADASEAGAGSSCSAAGAACATSADCCSVNCDPVTKTCGAPVGGVGACKLAGESCAAPTDCCGVVCTSGTCGATLCTSDNQPCASDAECCGGKCGASGDGGAKVCAPLNTTCKTSGNRCGANAECCSKLCQNGVCNANPSFCTQLGDACSADAECCGGACTKAAGATLGTCAVAPTGGGVPGCVSAGQVCASATTGDGGAIPNCGGECCSRSCRPWAATGVLVCQPPSGCHPTGELCLTDKDCCGALGSAGSVNSSGGGKSTDVHCEKAAGATVGRCDNGKACSPAGAICRLASNSCNATDRCCSGTVQQHPLDCALDALGIPRCTAANDYDCKKSGPPPAGTACASSADCCGNPCLPNPAGTPPFACGAAACVPAGGTCTTTADCCAGSPCVVPAGSTEGKCGPSGVTGGGTDAGGSTGGGTGGGTGGTTCAQYGQVCAQSADCCNGVPCTNGRCGVLIK